MAAKTIGTEGNCMAPEKARLMAYGFIAIGIICAGVAAVALLA